MLLEWTRGMHFLFLAPCKQQAAVLLRLCMSPYKRYYCECAGKREGRLLGHDASVALLTRLARR